MKLTEALKPLQLNITPAYGDPNGSHITIEVVSDSFEGESVVARHRMIYKAIWDELQVRMVKKTSTMRKPKATSDDQRVSSMCL
mmetsp:Transcript_11515/g.47941  ORF Transcript_11515/g.47941 Transcript_11515/m.47941 type:complete len:84 (+) Transcript_11515:614-865(+)